MATSGYEVFQIYVAIKSHFNSKYDYFKYHGLVKVTYESYLKRNDTQFFERVGQKVYSKQIASFMVANFVEKNDMWIGTFIDDYDGANETYLNWRIRLNQLYKNYEEDIKNIISFCQERTLAIQDIFEYNPRKHPIIFRFMMEEVIDKETFILLDNTIGFVKPLTRKYKDDLIWNKKITDINNYAPFIQYDPKRIKGLTNKLRSPQ